MLNKITVTSHRKPYIGLTLNNTVATTTDAKNEK